MIYRLSVEVLTAYNSRHNHLGVRDNGQLEANAERPFATFGGVDLFPTLWDKAGVLLHAFASTQVFADGNKRTAWAATTVFLQQNGYPLIEIPDDDIVSLVLAVAQGRVDEADASRWLRARSASRRPLPTFSPPDADRCVFCGRSDVTGGPLLPFWMLGAHTLDRGDVTRNWRDKAGNDFLEAQAASIYTDRITGFCQTCVQTWMLADDRAAAEGLLEVVETSQVSERSAAAIAVWASRLAVLADLREPQSAVPVSGARHIARHRSAPSNWRVWLCLASTDAQETMTEYYLRHNYVGLLNQQGRLNVMHQTSMVIDHFGLVVIGGSPFPGAAAALDEAVSQLHVDPALQVPLFTRLTPWSPRRRHAVTMTHPENVRSISNMVLEALSDPPEAY